MPPQIIAQVKTCPHCKGSGHESPVAYGKCLSCNGKGTVNNAPKMDQYETYGDYVWAEHISPAYATGSHTGALAVACITNWVTNGVPLDHNGWVKHKGDHHIWYQVAPTVKASKDYEKQLTIKSAIFVKPETTIGTTMPAILPQGEAVMPLVMGVDLASKPDQTGGAYYSGGSIPSMSYKINPMTAWQASKVLESAGVAYVSIVWQHWAYEPSSSLTLVNIKYMIASGVTKVFAETYTQQALGLIMYNASSETDTPAWPLDIGTKEMTVVQALVLLQDHGVDIAQPSLEVLHQWWAPMASGALAVTIKYGYLDGAYTMSQNYTPEQIATLFPTPKKKQVFVCMTPEWTYSLDTAAGAGWGVPEQGTGYAYCLMDAVSHVTTEPHIAIAPYRIKIGCKGRRWSYRGDARGLKQFMNRVVAPSTNQKFAHV